MSKVAGSSVSDPQVTFSRSILVSAIRCTFSYVFIPFVAPFLGFAPGIGPRLGIAIGLVALGANFFSIYRFWKADHKYKWFITVLNLSVIGLLLVLLFQDINSL